MYTIVDVNNMKYVAFFRCKHPSLLSFMMRSIFSSCVCVLALLLLTLSFHEISTILLWNL